MYAILSCWSNIIPQSQQKNRESPYKSGISGTEFAKKAREEGFEEIAVMFDHVAAIEKSHEERFMKVFIEVKKSLEGRDKEAAPPELQEPVKKKPGYRCTFCGAIFDNRPDVCPVCKAIGAFDLVERS